MSYSRLLGGPDHDEGLGIAIPAGCSGACNAYIEGITFSPAAAFVPGPVTGTNSGRASLFVTDLAANAQTAAYTTFIGAPDFPTIGAINGIAVDTAGEAFVVGATASQNFPLVGQIETAPAHNGVLLNFAASGTTTNPAWPPSNGSALNIQSAGTGPLYDVATTAGLFITTDGVTFSKAAATGLPAGPLKPGRRSTLHARRDLCWRPIRSLCFARLGQYLHATFLAGANKQSIATVTDVSNSAGLLTSRQVIAGTVGAGA